MRAQREQPRPRPGRCWIGLIVALVSIVGTAQAGEIRELLGNRPSRDDGSLRKSTFANTEARARQFGDRELLPRVGSQLEPLIVFRSHADMPGARAEDHVLFSEMHDQVRRGTERAVRKAVKRYVLGLVEFDRSVDKVKTSIRGDRSESRKVRWDVGVSHFIPEVGLRTAVGSGQLKIRLSVDGAAGISFRSRRMKTTEVYAGFDGDEDFNFRYRLSF